MLFLDTLIAREPENTDYILYRARIFAWTRNYKLADEIAQAVYSKDSLTEALALRVQIASWRGDSLSSLNLGLTYLEKNYQENIAVLTARSALAQRQFDLTDSLGLLILKNNPSSKQAKAIRRDIERLAYPHMFRLQYTLDVFSKALSPWHTASAEGGIQSKRTLWVLRNNFAERYAQRGYQIEAEAYSNFSHGLRTISHLAYSESALYPKINVGLEAYKTLGTITDASAGATLMHFPSNDVWIYTAQAGIYPGNYWLSFRAYIVPQNNALNPSFLLNSRRYFRTRDEYIGAQLGYGSYLPQQLTKDEVQRQDAYRAGLQWQWQVAARTYFTGLATYALEDYPANKNLSRFTLQVGLMRRFR